MTRQIKLLTLSLLLCCLEGISSEKDEFFKPSRDTSVSYAEDKVYPQGRIFPYSGFSPCNSAGEKKFTMLGPVYGKQDKLLEMAEKTHKKAIYFIKGVYKGEKVSQKTLELKDIDFNEIVESIRQQVMAVADNKNIAWWYLGPEELRCWRKNEMKYLQVAANAIREADPLKRPVWMYDPGHRSAKPLGETVKFLDISGKGMYTNYSGFKDSRIFCLWTIEQEVEAIKNTNPQAMPIAVPEMFQEPGPEEIQMVSAWVRHDVYSSLIAGAKGIVVFSFAHRKNFKSHEIYFQEYSRIADELCGELNLGQVFLFGEKRNDISLKITEGPEKVSFLCKGAGMKDAINFPSVNIFNAAYKNERYLFLVSSANLPVSVEIKGMPQQCVIEDVFSKKKIVLGGEPCLKLVFNPLEAKCIKIKP
ncbi:MAG: hypothetical protein A2017_14220 [Lentisphaerae bacterium GWF2_44_16]|nr:MAG: hypothetical protein A2017_14220 [Lentisphaerae bacterium GWF2_44_16]